MRYRARSMVSMCADHGAVRDVPAPTMCVYVSPGCMIESRRSVLPANGIVGACAPMIYFDAEILLNPGMGIATFQHFDGDSLYPTRHWWEEKQTVPIDEIPTLAADQAPSVSNYYYRWYWEQGPLSFSGKPSGTGREDYPRTTLAYCRWYWDVLEPEKGQYNWALVDNALLTAHRRGQTLMIRLMPQSKRFNNTPAWYMDEAAGWLLH